MARTKLYDVFLSHNSDDKPAVEYLAQRLRQEAELKPFLDKWHLVPGEPWQEALEEALDQSRTCAVFLGPGGLSPWENEEMRSALETRVREPAFRVIPVLLPDTQMPEKRELPRFLRRLTWVDFRGGLDDADAFDRLVSGIKGIAPGPPGEVKPPVEAVPPNPFVPWRGRLTDEALFYGRERELRELTQLVASRQSVSLLGERRVGKSSLLHQLMGRAGRLSPAPECLYVDMQLVADEADFYALVLGKLGRTGDTWRAFRNVVQGQYTLLALDEFEKARKEDLFSFQLRHGLRALAQQGLTLVIATRQPLDRLFADSDGKTSPLYNLCQRYRLGPLVDENEARGLIAAYLAPTGVRFSEDEIAEALRLSAGHPGRLQQVSWHLYEARRRPEYDWRAGFRADPQE
ncbi:MAG: TIR domain-containing protein [Promethearchaeota archaeon]